MGRNKPDRAELWTTVAGVTFESRQAVIRKFCKDGSDLYIRPEPNNPHSRNALGIWVQAPGGLFSKGNYRQVGYVPQEDADEIKHWVDQGWTTTAWVWKVVGGEGGLNYGLRINILLSPPGGIERAAGNADTDVKPVRIRKQWRLPSLPATTTKKMLTWGMFGVSRGLGFIALGLPIGWILGRPSDILGLGVIMAAVGAGLWGVGFTFSTQDPKAEGVLDGGV